MKFNTLALLTTLFVALPLVAAAPPRGFHTSKQTAETQEKVLSDILSAKQGETSRARAEELRDAVLSMPEHPVADPLAHITALLGFAAIQKNVGEIFYKNKHNFPAVKAAIETLVEQKIGESAADSLLRKRPAITIMDDLDVTFIARAGLRRDGHSTLEINLCALPTEASTLFATAHELVHIDKRHRLEKIVMTATFERARFPEAEEAKMAFSKCHEIEADAHAVFDRDVLNRERLQGGREYLEHSQKITRTLYTEKRTFIQPIREAGIDLTDMPTVQKLEKKFEEFSQAMNTEHPSEQERLENLAQLEVLADRHGGSLPAEMISKHVKSNPHCQGARRYLKKASAYELEGLIAKKKALVAKIKLNDQLDRETV